MKKHIYQEKAIVLHWNMALIGGFLGTYALLLRGGNFGSAQTGNLMEMMISLSRHNYTELAVRIGAAVVYAVSLTISYILTNYTERDMRKLVLKVEAIGLIISACIPVSVNPILALYPVFAMMSFQWGTYSGVNGYNSASVFMTNNFKQTVFGWVRFCLEHDSKAKEKAILYTVTVVSFLIGAFLGCIAVPVLETYAAFVCFIPLITARVILFYEDKTKH